MKAQPKIVLAVIALALVITDAQAMRWYSPSTGRWFSRDPAGERGFYQANLNILPPTGVLKSALTTPYVFVANDGVNATDYLGLWKWKYGTRDGHRRATVVAEECGEPYTKLALLVRLDVKDIQKWLKVWKPNEQVKKGEEFTVPNTVYVNDLVPWTQPWWKSWRLAETYRLQSQGFFVIVIHDPLEGAMLNEFKSKDVFGIVVVGHADSFSPGDIVTAEGNFVRPNNAAAVLDHKLGGLKLVICYGGAKATEWQGILAPGGTWYGPDSLIDIFDAQPGMIFHGF